jgi:hypothetical protein
MDLFLFTNPFLVFKIICICTGKILGIKRNKYVDSLRVFAPVFWRFESPVIEFMFHTYIINLVSRGTCYQSFLNMLSIIRQTGTQETRSTGKHKSERPRFRRRDNARTGFFCFRFKSRK